MENEKQTNPTVETKPETTETKTTGYEKFANMTVNELKGNTEFNMKASADLNQALVNLSVGDNPSAKYLVQKIEQVPNMDQFREFVAKLSPTEEFIGEGRGAEYILTRLGVVNSMDGSKFVPEIVNDIDRQTYVDTMDLPEIAEGDNTQEVENTIRLYRYIPYYLSGKAEQVANIIKNGQEQSLDINHFIRYIRNLKQMYTVIAGKQSSTEQAPTNFLAGTKTEPIDCITEFKNFIFRMTAPNVQFNYGIDSDGGHSDFTATYNSARLENLRFISDYKTYNNLKKYAITYLSPAEVRSYFDENKWVILPPTVYNNDKPNGQGGRPTDVGSIDELQLFYNENGERQAGTIMVVEVDGIKRAYNYNFTSAVWYQKNNATQVITQKNRNIKTLKWTQCAVYYNPNLENDYSIPVRNITPVESQK